MKKGKKNILEFYTSINIKKKNNNIIILYSYYRFQIIKWIKQYSCNFNLNSANTISPNKTSDHLILSIVLRQL